MFTPYIMEQLNKFDVDIDTILMIICGHRDTQLPLFAQLIRSLPFKMGGCGMARAVDVAPRAWSSSFAKSMQQLRRFCPALSGMLSTYARRGYFTQYIAMVKQYIPEWIEDSHDDVPDLLYCWKNVAIDEDFTPN